MITFLFIGNVQVVTRVPCATQTEMEAAGKAASEAYKSWSQTSVLTRQQLMFKYQQLIKENMASKLDLGLDTLVCPRAEMG